MIDYTVTVVNTGNQTLTGVSVSDPLLPGLSGPTESGTVNGSLDVGETWVYTGSYAVTQPISIRMAPSKSAIWVRGSLITR